MPHPPRLRVKLFGTDVSGEGIVGVIGAIVAVCTIMFLYPIYISWAAARLIPW